LNLSMRMVAARAFGSESVSAQNRHPAAQLEYKFVSFKIPRICPPVGSPPATLAIIPMSDRSGCRYRSTYWLELRRQGDIDNSYQNMA
jgi:hypothetical protein